MVLKFHDMEAAFRRYLRFMIDVASTGRMDFQSYWILNYIATTVIAI